MTDARTLSSSSSSTTNHVNGTHAVPPLPADLNNVSGLTTYVGALVWKVSFDDYLPLGEHNLPSNGGEVSRCQRSSDESNERTRQENRYARVQLGRHHFTLAIGRIDHLGFLAVDRASATATNQIMINSFLSGLLSARWERWFFCLVCTFYG